MRDKLGGTDEMHGVDAGYENKVLDLMEQKTSSLGGAHLMGSARGPHSVQIVAGPQVNFATLGASGDPSAAEVALGVGVAAAAGYGIYKLASGPSSSGPSKPWLYKANPSYWFKSDREKRYTQALKEGSFYDAQKAKELELAQRAYYVTEGVRDKESKLQQFDASLANPSAPAPTTATSGDDSNLPPEPRDYYLSSNKMLWNRFADGEYAVWSYDVEGYRTPMWSYAFRRFNDPHYGMSMNSEGSFVSKQDAVEAAKKNLSTHEYVGVSPKAIRLTFRRSPGTIVNGDDSPPPGYPPPARPGSNTGPAGYPLPGAAPRADKKVLSALSKAGYPIQSGTTWNKDVTPATKALDIVTSVLGDQDAAKAWLLAFFERQNIAFQGNSGKVYEVHGGRLVIAAPDAPADVTISTSKGAKPTGKVSGASSPWEKGTEFSTAFRTAAPTMMPTTGSARRTNVKGMFVGYGQSPWEKSLGFNTAVSLVNSTEMPSTGAPKRSTAVRGWASNPWEKNTEFSTSYDTAMSTIKPTTGARRRTNVKGWEKKMAAQMPTGRKQFVGYSSSPWEKGTIDSTVMSTIDPTFMPTTGGRRGAVRSSMKGSPWSRGTAYSTAYDTAMSTMMPTTGPRKINKGSNVKGMFVGYSSSPWEKGTIDATVMSTIDPTFMPTTGGRRGAVRSSMRGNAFVGAATPAQTQLAQAKLVTENMARHQNANIQQLASAAGLGGKKTWTAANVDTVAAGLLKKMMTTTGQKPDGAQANIARNVVRAWTGLVGVSVMGNAFVGNHAFVGNRFVGGSVMGGFGSFLKSLGKVAVTPALATFWGIGKAVQGTGWLLSKGGKGLAGGSSKGLGALWGGGKGGAPGAPGAAGMVVPGALMATGPTGMTPQQMAMYRQAAARKAAASQRILAAESAQEAALVAQQQASDLQTAQQQAMEAEDAAQTAEKIAMQAQASSDLPETPQALQDTGVSGMSGWGGLKSLPPGYVGPNAIAAIQPNKQGKDLRTGASVARSARKNPVVAKQVKVIEVKAAKGDPKAVHQNAVIKAGAVADHQRLDALHTDALVKRKHANLAHAVFRRVLKVGGANTGVFAKWNPGRGGIVTIGADAKGAAKKLVGNYPPPIPGVPADIIVALTAASNTFGVPPTVAASVVAAARSGDPKAKKELLDASKVYKAAQMGDPSAKRQMAAVVADMKAGHAPAAEKAAIMAAAIGTTKGTKNFKMRKRAQAIVAQKYAMADSSPPKIIPDNVWPASFMKLISFGVGPGFP